ncbi:hypothetical protein ACLM5J_19320 [Nocardioides sp. Bht2]|uniref:hypothetical protein n=1 Tax=Nocardioides sp. Bht2 TaxID=3392297 RepID=UPI0039B64688
MSSPVHLGAPPNWVPVERRFLGMDRSTLLPAGLVAALVAIAIWLLPAIDGALSVDDPARAGDVIRVGEAEFAPAVGWNIEAGLRAGSSTSGTYPEKAVVTRGGLTFTLTTGAFDGTPRELVAQLRKNNDRLGPNAVAIDSSMPTTIVNAHGDRGALARFSSAGSEGLIGAFVFDGVGAEIVTYGPAEIDDSALAADVVAMIRSVQSVQGTDGGNR